MIVHYTATHTYRHMHTQTLLISKDERRMTEKGRMEQGREGLTAEEEKREREIKIEREREREREMGEEKEERRDKKD